MTPDQIYTSMRKLPLTTFKGKFHVSEWTPYTMTNREAIGIEGVRFDHFEINDTHFRIGKKW